jgi:predicted O-linked N-acetylglucosamine transferase (SPINDLY family)
MTFDEALALQQRGDADAAERAYRALLASEPQHVLAALNLGALLFTQGRLTEAADCYRQILAHSPRDIGALNNLSNALQAAGQIDEALAAYRQVLQLVTPPLAYRVASNYLLTLNYHPALSDETLRAATEEIGRQMGQAQNLPARPVSPVIRIGFVSADLCDHPVGLFLLPLMARLDRSQFHIVFYSNGSRQDHTARLLQGAGQWKDISSLDHDAAAQLIRSDAIDVLFDLSGHTSGNRLPVFARRAAPVQVTWLGYFATTGVPAMDFIVMDPSHAPAGAEAQFSEKLLRLPYSRFCYEPVIFAPEVAPPPCLQQGWVTFGSFNNTAKLNDGVLAVWAEILHRVPESRLILKWRTFADAELRRALLARFAEFGIAAERIELREQSVHRRLLEEYADVDIALDPFPFSGGHTSCEALWMGLPVVTLPGSRPVSRQTLCFLANISLQEFAAQDEADYIAKAVTLAGNPDRLRSLRGEMRNRMRASPLMDADGFAAAFAQLVDDVVRVNTGSQIT